MNKTKKITNIHDYSKEVDKIIATGKPMVEQFMDLMGLMDVTFIDENQTSNGRLHQLTKSDSSIKRPKKQDSSVQDKQTSDCCGAKVLSVQGYPKDEGTHYWQCSKCGRPCDIMNPCGSQTKRKRDATTGSTAAVHHTMAKTPQLDWRDKYLDKFGTTPHKGIEDFITELLNKKKRLKKTLKSSQNEVFGIGGKIDRFFLSGDDITLYKINRFIRKLLLDILKHNQDPMTGLYDYDGIAQDVIDLVNE